MESSNGLIHSVLCEQAMAYDLSHMPENSLKALSNLKLLLPGAIHALCQSTSVKKGSLIFQTGKKPQWMFFVVSGEVTLERLSQQGDPVVLQRTRHGFVSEASLQSPNYHCDGRAAANSDIIQIPLAALADALNTDPAFAGRWISMLNLEVKRLRLQCERLNMKSVKDRLLHLIQTEGNNGQYQVNTGLKSLASELGVTHEALYRSLATLEKQAVIRREAKMLAMV
jgi:CRP-like cAMP-binding protein